MNNLQILTAPHPILTTRAKEIDIVDKGIQVIMDRMLQTMYDDDGAGLAANQVGILKRIIVIDLQDETSEDVALFPLKMANPKILSFSAQTSHKSEGCLSLPGQRIEVERPEQIVVEYLDYNNRRQVLDVNGWTARAIQHEIDHLDGKLLINYLSHMKRTMALKKLSKLKAQVV
ncbi:MAG: peptide deformylase [Rickettsiaceae bacterium]|nr:peptide deformylase [Rickettsiaceae bacterium]